MYVHIILYKYILIFFLPYTISETYFTNSKDMNHSYKSVSSIDNVEISNF